MLDNSKIPSKMDFFLRAHRTLLDITKIDTLNLKEFLQKAAELDASTINTSRVGIWWLSEDGSEIICADQYETGTGRHSEGEVLKKEDFPVYFEALNTGRLISANDARNDKRTSCFTEQYLKPKGIYSMLDVPIRSGGKIRGVICHEHTGEIREWTKEEKDFAASLSDIINSVIEASERRKAEAELKERTELLEKINKIAFELASFPGEKSIKEFLVRKQKEIIGSDVGWFADYILEDRVIKVGHFSVKPGIMEKAIILFGGLPEDIKSPISEETYKSLSKVKIAIYNSLTEMSYGAVPFLVSMAVQKLLGIDKLICIGFFIEGEFLGGTISGLKKDQPIPKKELLEAFSSLGSLALWQRKAEEKEKKAREAYQSLIENINDAIYSINQEGIVLYVSPVIKKLLGYEPEELTGKHMTKFFLKEEAQLEKLKKDFENIKDGDTVSNEYRFITKKGEVRWMRTSTKPVVINGKTNGITGVLTDIHDYKMAQEAIEKSQKIELLGVIAGGIAHDFNNLLSGIFGHIETAKLKAKHNPEVVESLDKSLNVFNRARDLTYQFLTFTKGGEPAKITGDLKTVLQKSAKFALSGSTFTLNFKLQEDLWLSDFDENQIGRVIDNAVINAMQSMEVGGVITITARNLDLKAGDLPSPKAVGRYVLFSIKDTGAGIPKEILPKIFDPFFTTKKKGSGLGLSAIYSIIKKHNGFVYVDSEEGKGATISFYLPASLHSSIKVREPQKSDGKRKTGTGRIFVMDDEEDILQLISIILEEAGYSVQTAKNGEEAFKGICEAQKIKKDIDLVITDLTIAGGKGGKELLKDLRNAGISVPVIASSGYSADDVMSKPATFGFADKLGKPYLADELLEVVAKHLAGKNK